MLGLLATIYAEVRPKKLSQAILEGRLEALKKDKNNGDELNKIMASLKYELEISKDAETSTKLIMKIEEIYGVTGLLQHLQK